MQGIQIDPIATDEPPYKVLTFDENLSIEFLPNSHILEMWDRLYKESNTRLF